MSLSLRIAKFWQLSTAIGLTKYRRPTQRKYTELKARKTNFWHQMSRRTWRYCGRYVCMLCGLYYGVYPSPVGSVPRQYQGRIRSPWSHSHDPGDSHSKTGDSRRLGQTRRWQVTVHTVTGAARQDPESVIVSSKAPTCPNPGASHARVIEQLDTRLVTLASRQQLHWGTWMVMWSPATKSCDYILMSCSIHIHGTQASYHTCNEIKHVFDTKEQFIFARLKNNWNWMNISTVWSASRVAAYVWRLVL